MEKLTMYRVTMLDMDLEFYYVMKDESSGKYRIVNFTRNYIIEYEYNTIDKAEEFFKKALDAKIIIEYDKL